MNALAEKIDTQEMAASRSAMYQALGSAFFYSTGDRLQPCRIDECLQKKKPGSTSAKNPRRSVPGLGQPISVVTAGCQKHCGDELLN